MSDPGTTVLGAAGWSPELVAALAHATEAAVDAARAWVGLGDKNAADGAAVAAMRAVLADAPFDGTVVIGEGEKDDAPMLANGERLGAHSGDSHDGDNVACDIAVDPLDGTRLVAEGIPGSIAVIALAPRGSMFDPAGEFYMDKLVCGSEGIGVVDIRKSPTQNVAALSVARGVAPSDLVVVVLDKPRHDQLIAELRAAGATVKLLGEGDVAAAVAAATEGSGVDLVLGIGGTPEGVVAACAVRALGGFMQGRIGDRVLELDDLVAGDRVLFVMTAV